MRPPLTIVEQPVVLRAGAPRRGAPGETAVWDVDGTLVLGDTLLPFLRRFTGIARLAGILADVGIRYGGRRDAAKSALLHRVLGGRELAEVDRVARDYVLTVLAYRLRPDSVRRVRWHQSQGHRIVLASASPELYLRHLGNLLGVTAVLSTTMETVNGRLTGLQSSPNLRGERKAERIREYLAAHPTGRLWAYGNSRADEPMLAMADVPVRVSVYRRLPSLQRSE